ncbi:MAG: arginine--tRNA ligase [Candidatus Micrarchaeota archaeon]|nr:MAG: arginine--tRNA ligase [Candidatus Micrarchaeota archaeon]
MELAYIEAYNRLSRAVSESLGKERVDEIDSYIDIESRYADIATNAPIRLSKAYNLDYKIVSSSIIENLRSYGLEAEFKNGFVNVVINADKIVESLYKILKDPKSLLLDIFNNKRIVVEFPSANPVHPLHLGHLRNFILGDFIYRLYKYLGADPVRLDYIDDLGLQAAQALYGYINLKLDDKAKFDHALGKLYVEVNRSEELKKASEELLVKIERADPSIKPKLDEMVNRCVEAHYQTEELYGVYHDLKVKESDIVEADLLDKALDLLKSRGIADLEKEGRYANCLVVDLAEISEEFKGMKENKKVLVRSNGTATYVAKDIAFHMWKLGLFKDPFRYKIVKRQPDNTDLYEVSGNGIERDFISDTAINIIDYRQSYPQMVLKAIIERFDSTKRIRHIAYGIVNLEETKLSGRKGTWIGNTADDLFYIMKEKIDQSFKINDDHKLNRLANAAIRFEFLRFTNDKDISFSWSRALDINNASGPYALYTYARANKLVVDSGIDTSKIEISKELLDSNELRIAKLIVKSQLYLIKAERSLDPSILVNHISKLLVEFNSFYERYPILKEDNEQKRLNRLALTKSFAETLRILLNILGIEVLDII